jgi:hypothetical protein
LPQKIISDRDPWFTSHFGKALTARLRLSQNLSMAFHPQTDGLSEWKNQWVKQYLRLVTSSSPEDWTQWISIATAVHNNQKNSTTSLTPNKILISYEPDLAPPETPVTNNKSAEEHIRKLLEQQAQALNAINEAAKGEDSILEQY